MNEQAPEEGGGRHLIVVPATQMAMKAPKWLYDRRIPAGAITLLGGREGIGKTTIAFDLAARVTRGELPGQYEGTPSGVAIVASEDDWSAVILPRLVAAGADLARIFRIEAQTETGEYETVSVPADLTDLAALCTEHRIVMLIIDPIMSVIHSGIDTHKDREVRRALDPLSRFTASSGVAAFGLIHVNKSTSTDPLTSLMASRAFSAVARSVLYCIVDPEAENEDRFLFGHPKSNLGPKQPTLTYRLLECKLEIADVDDVITTSRVIWEGQDRRSIREAMDPKRPERTTGEVATRILDFLGEEMGAVSHDQIAQALADVPRNTLSQNLARMVKRGTLIRPHRGFYSLPPTASDTSSGASDSVTSVISVTDGQPNDTNDTNDTRDDVSGVSLPLSLVPEQWPSGSYGEAANTHQAAE